MDYWGGGGGEGGQMVCWPPPLKLLGEGLPPLPPLPLPTPMYFVLQLYKHINIYVSNTSYGIRTEAKSL